MNFIKVTTHDVGEVYINLDNVAAVIDGEDATEIITVGTDSAVSIHNAAVPKGSNQSLIDAVQTEAFAKFEDADGDFIYVAKQHVNVVYPHPKGGAVIRLSVPGKTMLRIDESIEDVVAALL